MINDEDELVFAKKAQARWLLGRRVSSWIGGLGMLGSIVLGIFGGFGLPFNVKCPVKVAEAIVLGLWVLLPPIWFWYEYFFLYKDIPKVEREKIEEFKHGQDQSAKLWLALITVLLGLYFEKDLVKDSPVEVQKVIVVQPEHH